MLLFHTFTEKFEEVTILFSDIVTFTVIASKVAPIQIVEMLNALYSEFDSLINVHSVYKASDILNMVVTQRHLSMIRYCIIYCVNYSKYFKTKVLK